MKIFWKIGLFAGSGALLGAGLGYLGRCVSGT